MPSLLYAHWPREREITILRARWLLLRQNSRTKQPFRTTQSSMYDTSKYYFVSHFRSPSLSSTQRPILLCVACCVLDASPHRKVQHRRTSLLGAWQTGRRPSPREFAFSPASFCGASLNFFSEVISKLHREKAGFGFRHPLPLDAFFFF